MEEASVAVQSTSNQPITSTAVKAAKKSSPALKIAEPLTPIIELQRMPTAEYKDSGARRKTVQKSQKKVLLEDQTVQLAKKLAMTERQVERWWRMRKALNRPTTLEKFNETG